MAASAVLQTSDPLPPAGTEAVPANQWLPNILMAAAVVLLIVVVLGKTRQRAIARSKQPVLDPAERLEAIRERARAEGSIEGRVAQAADQIRELTAVLDTRIAHLDALIVQADERIAKLTDQHPRPTYEAHDQGGVSESPRTIPAGSVASQKHDIYALADQGLTPNEIASRLGQHSGKIELILALRRA